MAGPISVEITESVTTVEATNANTALTISPTVTEVKAYNLALPAGVTPASAILSTAYGSITATNVQDALEQLADQSFRQAAAPTGATVSEGDTWYDTDDEDFKVYRETSTGVFEWVPIMLGTPPGDSDIVDAGAF
jgi:hypothetical protein